MSRRRGKVVFFIVLLGGIIGAILGHILKDIVPILDKGLKVGTDSLSLNLYLIDMSFGIHINITLGAIIGLLIAFLLADVGRRRL
ncbi:MAG: DUF4321 domain-containing protein [Actinobacteria bacterium]|uniref:DUF4321 domain-containing protein n=1 Tax=marine sediment metagenome TaxID=412755 RepID=X1SWN4_9ZZZZ|nr:MAG: DUF4321 domain-containing protein [Actinomycetota bacterium]